MSLHKSYLESNVWPSEVESDTLAIVLSVLYLLYDYIYILLFTASTGGLLGLFIGASILTLLEVIELLGFSVTYNVNKYIRKKYTVSGWTAENYNEKENFETIMFIKILYCWCDNEHVHFDITLKNIKYINV